MIRIVYYVGGAEVGSTPHSGPLEEARKFATDGLIRHNAEAARIIDADTGAEVDSVVRKVPLDES